MLLHIRCKNILKLFLGLITDPLMQDISLSIDEIETWTIFETQSIAKFFGLWVADFQIGKFDLAKIFRFEPMDHGRHLLAGRSPEFKEFDKLQTARCQFDGGRVGGFEVGSARSGDGKRRGCGCFCRRGSGLRGCIHRRSRCQNRGSGLDQFGLCRTRGCCSRGARSQKNGQQAEA
jgi:hypothetical protein